MMVRDEKCSAIVWSDDRFFVILQAERAFVRVPNKEYYSSDDYDE